MPRFIIYGRMSCPYTKMAVDHGKKTFKKECKFINISKIPKSHDDQLKKRNHNTIPAVFKKHGKGYRFIGGYTEFMNSK